MLQLTHANTLLATFSFHKKAIQQSQSVNGKFVKGNLSLLSLQYVGIRLLYQRTDK